MKGLLLKDFYLIKKYCRSYLILLIIFLIVSVFGDNNSFFLFYPTLVSGLIPVTLISFDEREKWDIYCSTLPYTKKQIVTEKYLIGFLFELSVATTSLLLQAIKMIMHKSFILDDFLLLIGTISIIGLICPSIFLPLIIKLGAEKGRIAYYIFVGLLCAIITIVSGNLSLPMNKLDPKFFVTIVLILSIIMYIISLNISIKIYENKEIS